MPNIAIEVVGKQTATYLPTIEACLPRQTGTDPKEVGEEARGDRQFWSQELGPGRHGQWAPRPDPGDRDRQLASD